MSTEATKNVDLEFPTSLIQMRTSNRKGKFHQCVDSPLEPILRGFLISIQELCAINVLSCRLLVVNLKMRDSLSLRGRVWVKAWMDISTILPNQKGSNAKIVRNFLKLPIEISIVYCTMRSCTTIIGWLRNY
jgi:hypothetical protein